MPNRPAPMSSPDAIARHRDRAARTTTADELAWFDSVAPTWPWRWARTYADTFPHAYVVKGKHDAQGRAVTSPSPDPHARGLPSLDETSTTGQPHPILFDYERAFLLAYAAGASRKFFSRTNVELDRPDLALPYGPTRDARATPTVGMKFWPMTERIEVSRVLNTAPADQQYGDRQDAPVTIPPDYREHPHDLTAGLWSDLALSLDPYRLLHVPVWRLVQGTLVPPRTMIDLGPRIGHAFDLNLVPDHTAYTGVSPSRGLANVMAYRYPRLTSNRLGVGDPDSFVHHLASSSLRTPVDVAVALFGTASELSPTTIRKLPSIASRLVLMFYDDPSVDDWFGPTHVDPASAASALAAARDLPGADTLRMDRFQTVVVTHARG